MTLLPDESMIHAVCGECGRAGDVVEERNPGIPYAGWDCPECGATNDTTRSVYPEPGDAL